MASTWTSNTALSVGNIIAPTSSNAGLLFKVTTAGTTGTSEPSWTTEIGNVIYDNNVRYISISGTFSDLQPINPSAIIELFVLQLNSTLHGASTIYRFHSGSNMNANGQIVWAGNSYLRYPITVDGFAYKGKDKIPRPKLRVSNGMGLISTILLTVNQTTAGNDLTGATVTRIRTLAKYLDAVNFTGNSNPYGTPDPNVEFPKEIYSIDRKSTENRELVEFELASVLDLVGVTCPKRQCTRADFPSIGTFI